MMAEESPQEGSAAKSRAAQVADAIQAEAADADEVEEVSAYIELTQDGPRDQRVRIERSAIIKAYAELAMEIPGCELFPAHGVGQRSPVGPYQIYASEEDIDAILAETATLFIKDPPPTRGLSMKKIIIDEDKATHGESNIIQADAVHVIAFLDAGACFRYSVAKGRYVWNSGEEATPVTWRGEEERGERA